MPSLLMRLTESPPNAEATAYAIRLIRAAYNGTPQPAIMGVRESGPMMIQAPPFPKAWIFQEGGTRVVIVMGTTDPPSEIGPQFIGYQQTSPVPGGIANKWYRDAAIVIGSALPTGADIVIGHSMGGAIAVELTQIMRQTTSVNAVGVAIAAPRGRSLGAADGVGSWMTHVVGEHDPVPYLPGSITGGTDWRHGGRYYTMDSLGVLRATPEVYASLDTAALVAARWLPMGGHSTQTYERAISIAIAPPYISTPAGGEPPVIDP